MDLSPRRVLRALYRRLVLAPRGAGHPVSAEAMDREFASGGWDHLESADELLRTRLLVDLITARSQRPDVLDVGCGTGILAAALPPGKRGAYLGIDISEEGLQRARARGLPDAGFERGNLEGWAGSGMFDAIVFNESLGYAADPGRALEGFARSLRPAGRFYVSIFRYGNSEAIWRRIAGVARIEHSETVVSGGKTWDVRVLCPGNP
jgi:SAM-dependent methyltransferase